MTWRLFSARARRFYGRGRRPRLAARRQRGAAAIGRLRSSRARGGRAGRADGGASARPRFPSSTSPCLDRDPGAQRRRAHRALPARDPARAARASSYEVSSWTTTPTRTTKALLAARARARAWSSTSRTSASCAASTAAPRQARGRHLVLLNNDTEPQPGWLPALVERAESAPDIGVVAAKLVYPDGTLQEAGGIVWQDGTAWNYGHGARRRRRPSTTTCARSTTARRRRCSSAPSCGARRRLRRALRARLLRGRRPLLRGPRARLARALRAAGAASSTSRAPRWAPTPASAASATRSSTSRSSPPSGAQALADQLAHPGLGARATSQPTAARGPLVLVVDHRVPTPDRDAGSLRMWHLLEPASSSAAASRSCPTTSTRPQPYTSRAAGAGRRGALRRRSTCPSGSPSSARACAWRSSAAPTSRRATCTSSASTRPARASPTTRSTCTSCASSAARELEAQRDDPAGRRGFRELELALARASDVTLVVSEEEREQLHARRPGASSVEVVADRQRDRRPTCPARPAAPGCCSSAASSTCRTSTPRCTSLATVMPLVWRELAGRRAHDRRREAARRGQALAAPASSRRLGRGPRAAAARVAWRWSRRCATARA